MEWGLDLLVVLSSMSSACPCGPVWGWVSVYHHLPTAAGCLGSINFLHFWAVCVLLARCLAWFCSRPSAASSKITAAAHVFLWAHGKCPLQQRLKSAVAMRHENASVMPPWHPECLSHNWDLGAFDPSKNENDQRTIRIGSWVLTACSFRCPLLPPLRILVYRFFGIFFFR